jgi:gamma-glutamyl-gamma-aminobutyrate hydrolase PuuD
LVGGGDVDPAQYGAEPDLEHNYGVEPDRDALELGLIHAADRAHLPTLAICRGMQVMNVAFGGTLHQHLPDLSGMLAHGVPLDDSLTTHDVKAAPGSRLLATAGVDVLSCSSHHHQGVDRIGDRLAPTGWSDDGLVEAIELQVEDPYADTWMLGVQWHPEDTATTDTEQQALFDDLVRQAHWRGTRARDGEIEGRGREYGLVDYDPAWPDRYETEAARIRSALGDLLVRIDHVGSTSVPGLAAKPVIDVQVSVRSLRPRAAVIEPLIRLGYRHTIDPIETQHELLTSGYDPDAPQGPRPPVRSGQRVGGATHRLPGPPADPSRRRTSVRVPQTAPGSGTPTRRPDVHRRQDVVHPRGRSSRAGIGVTPTG